MQAEQIEELRLLVKELHEATEQLYEIARYVHMGTLFNKEEASSAVKAIEKMADAVNLKAARLDDLIHRIL